MLRVRVLSLNLHPQSRDTNSSTDETQGDLIISKPNRQLPMLHPEVLRSEPVGRIRPNPRNRSEKNRPDLSIRAGSRSNCPSE